MRIYEIAVCEGDHTHFSLIWKAMNPSRWTFQSQFLGERGFKIWILIEGSVTGKVWRVAVVEEGVKWNLIPSVYGKGGDFGGRLGCARGHGDFGFTTPLIGRERCDKLGLLRASIESDDDNQLRRGHWVFPLVKNALQKKGWRWISLFQKKSEVFERASSYLWYGLVLFLMTSIVLRAIRPETVQQVFSSHFDVIY